MLTKSGYLHYVQCPLNFWLAEYHPETAAPPDPAAQRRMRMGQQVDQAAREQFREGVLIPWRPDPEEMVPLTEQAIAAGVPVLFQATFLAGDLLVKADIVQRSDSGWHLIEVKSSTSVKEEHLADAAFQFYVLRQAGLDVSRASIMHINKQCRYPDLGDLFSIEDVTADVLDRRPTIEEDIAEMRRLVALADEPAVPIGRYCKECAFHARCWEGIDGLTIYHIPRLNAAKEEQLEAAGVLYVDEVPRDFPLTEKQRAFVNFHARQEINIDAGAIRQALAALRFPLYFFDFETIDHAVPVYDGCTPYQQVPFQYSCHILYEDGTLIHRAYLHPDGGDPRPALLEALLKDIQDGGQVIAYHVPFERGVLNKLAGAFPAQAPHLQVIINRLWDQLPIFRKYYRHYGFGPSNSLKNVLPVVVPELSYEALAVQNGSQAQVIWEEMIATADRATKEQLAADLLAYCRLDTLAMVEIHHVLESL